MQISCSGSQGCLGSANVARTLTAVTAPVIMLVNSTFLPFAVVQAKQVSFVVHAGSACMLKISLPVINAVGSWSVA